jgi:hypothetical protein
VEKSAPHTTAVFPTSNSKSLVRKKSVKKENKLIKRKSENRYINRKIKIDYSDVRGEKKGLEKRRDRDRVERRLEMDREIKEDVASAL